MGNKSGKPVVAEGERISSGSDEGVPEVDFSYQSVGSDSEFRIHVGRGRVADKEYECFVSRKGVDGYYHFQNSNVLKGKPEIKSGWKIHISLKEFSDVVKAWNAILPVLIKHEVFEFKVRLPLLPVGLSFQPGKDIVLYCSSSRDDLNWGVLLREVEAVLLACCPGAPPLYRIQDTICDGTAGAPHLFEPKIPGSVFLYVARDDITLHYILIEKHLLVNVLVSLFLVSGFLKKRLFTVIDLFLLFGVCHGYVLVM